MNERTRLEELIAAGFQAGMFLRDLASDELRGAPEVYAGLTVKGLPLTHPDGRKIMFGLTDPEAIAFAESLVKEANTIIGYKLVVYCSGVGPDTIHGHELHLENPVADMQNLLGWDVTTSSFPHTFQVTFNIEGDDRQAVQDKQDHVRRVALALTLRNKHGFVVAESSPGERFKGQPFASTWGIVQRMVQGADNRQLEYVDQICQDEEALEAATALQGLYSQVTDTDKITMGWAAIEHIFGTRAQHLLTRTELAAVTAAIDQLNCVSEDKRTQLKDRIRNPDLISREGRNARIARRVSELLNADYEDIYDKVRSLTRERGRRVHSLADRAAPLKSHVEFVESVLWAIIDCRIGNCDDTFA